MVVVVGYDGGYNGVAGDGGASVVVLGYDGVGACETVTESQVMGEWSELLLCPAL